MSKIIWKNIGETPLECLNRARADLHIGESVPMTYAGRLDPMAEGKLLVLVGDECRERDRHLGLAKEYRVRIVFGFRTDTYDALGLAERGRSIDVASLPAPLPGCFVQKYPPYSSKTVGGVPLHELARRNLLPEILPGREVEILSVTEEGRDEISASELKREIFGKIDLVKGDFRQGLIKARWEDVLSDPAEVFPIIDLSIKCSSGTYMRSLAEDLGKISGSGAFAVSIIRTEIFMSSLPRCGHSD